MQIYAMPVFDMLETLLVKKLKFAPSFKLRLITRTLYVGEWLIMPFFLWMNEYDLFWNSKSIVQKYRSNVKGN